MPAESRTDAGVPRRESVRGEQNADSDAAPGTRSLQSSEHRGEAGIERRCTSSHEDRQIHVVESDGVDHHVETRVGADFERFDERAPIAGPIIGKFGEPSSQFARRSCQQFSFGHGAL